MDCIKVRMQSSSAYKGVVDCALQTCKKEGVRALFKVRRCDARWVTGCVSFHCSSLTSHF
jgi:hypothetical protein